VKLAALLLCAACAPGPSDVVETGGHDTHGGTGGGTPKGAYSYVARRPLVAVGLVDAQGIGDDDAHKIIDHVADAATECFKRSKNPGRAAARITLAFDEGGVAQTPQATFAPKEAAATGMVCLLAPLRMTPFPPAAADAGPRSITLESAWGE
jgi:hypothetical protein